MRFSVAITNLIAAVAVVVVTTTTVPSFTEAYTSSSWGMQTTRRTSPLMMTKSEQQGGSGKSTFSLTNLFGEGNGGPLGSGGGGSTLRGSNKGLEPHPSVLPHISPLNRLGPDPQEETTSEPLPIHPQVRSGTLPNGLPYIILPNKSPPGRFEAHLQVFSGSGKFVFTVK